MTLVMVVKASWMTNGVAADMEASRTSRPTERHD